MNDNKRRILDRYVRTSHASVCYKIYFKLFKNVHKNNVSYNVKKMFAIYRRIKREREKN
jgi:hypothetical protein